MRITQLLRLVLLLLAFVLPLASMASNDKDPELDSALDNYLQLLQSDDAAAKILLYDLWQRHETNPAIQSWARLASYMTSDSFNIENQEKMQALLQLMLQKAETTENPDALTEIYGTELEMLLLQSNVNGPVFNVNDAIIKADTLQFYLQRATDPRIRYYFNAVLGQIFKQDSQFSRSLKHYIDALEAVTETENEATARRKTSLNVQIAQIHAALKDWKKAREFSQSALGDAVKYDLKPFVFDMFMLQLYIAGHEKRFEDAVLLLKRGLTYFEKYGDEYFTLTFEINLGTNYVELGKYDAAKKVFYVALERAGRLDDRYSTELIKFNLGFIDVMQGLHQDGLGQMQVAIEYFKEKDNKTQFATNYEWLAKAYAAAGMHKEQADALLEQIDLLQEAQASEHEAKINELHNRYDRKNAERAAEVARLEQEKALQQQLLENEKLKRQSTIIVVVIVGVAALLLLYFYRKVAAANQKLNGINTQLAYQSKRDPLTGIFNRRALQQFMQQRSLKRRRQDNQTSSSSLLLLDIDHFKQINDQYGHSAGDAVLIAISERLLATVREQDMVVRWGGEEILLVLENLAPEQHHAFVERVLKTIGDVPVAYDDYVIKVTASGGFIPLPFAGVDEAQLGWEQLMQIIDLALYRSKANGRNQVCVVNALNVDYAEAKSLLFTDLSQAVDKGMVDISTINGPTMAVAQ